MASRWIVNKHSDTSLAFSELVSLARSGELTEDDLVKADWEPEWRPAHTVVGLFYRVRRTEREIVDEHPAEFNSAEQSSLISECAFSFDDLAADMTLEVASETDQPPPADPRWMQRYREVTEQRVAAAAAATLEPLENQTSIRLLADAAVAAQDRRSAFRDHLFRWQKRWARFREAAGSPFVFRLASAVFVAVLFSMSFASWSKQTALRFPKPGMPDRYVVPGLGDCTPREFRVVLIELAIVAAALGYQGAKRVEGWAEAR